MGYGGGWFSVILNLVQNLRFLKTISKPLIVISRIREICDCLCEIFIIC